MFATGIEWLGAACDFTEEVAESLPTISVPVGLLSAEVGRRLLFGNSKSIAERLLGAAAIVGGSLIVKSGFRKYRDQVRIQNQEFIRQIDEPAEWQHSPLSHLQEALPVADQIDA